MNPEGIYFSAKGGSLSHVRQAARRTAVGPGGICFSAKGGSLPHVRQPTRQTVVSPPSGATRRRPWQPRCLFRRGPPCVSLEQHTTSQQAGLERELLNDAPAWSFCLHELPCSRGPLAEVNQRVAWLVSGGLDEPPNQLLCGRTKLPTHRMPWSLWRKWCAGMRWERSVVQYL